jgi:hypothetical protein
VDNIEGKRVRLVGESKRESIVKLDAVANDFNELVSWSRFLVIEKGEIASNCGNCSGDIKFRPRGLIRAE